MINYVFQRDHFCEVWKINENGERMKVVRPANELLQRRQKLCWKLEFDGGNGQIPEISRRY